MSICLLLREGLIHAVLLGGASSSSGLCSRVWAAAGKNSSLERSGGDPGPNPRWCGAAGRDARFLPSVGISISGPGAAVPGAPVPAASRPPGITIVPFPLPHSQNSALPLPRPGSRLIAAQKPARAEAEMLFCTCVAQSGAGLGEMNLLLCFKCFLISQQRRPKDLTRV